MSNSVALATCVIYAILALPILFLLVRHGRQGFMGWLYLFVFATIRIVGGALAVKNTGTAASIISSVGISPLLLATSGILHEARTLRLHRLDEKVEWLQVLLYHMLVVVGVALTASGSAKLLQGEEPLDKAERIVKVGVAILAVAWAVLVGWTGITFLAPKGRSSVVRAGSTLLNCIAVGLVFIAIRVFYSVAALSTQKPSLSPIYGSLAVRVVLSLLPELIAALIFIAGGVVTQGDVAEADGKAEDVSRSQKPRSQPWV